MITNMINFCQFPASLDKSLLPWDLTQENAVFFDIETTGLSPRTSRVYLIGAVLTLPWEKKETSCRLVQYLAETPTDEEEKKVLNAFFQLLEGKKYAVHFNGTAFDVPYLQKRCMQHGLSFPLEGLIQTDLYKALKEFKPLLSQLPNRRQKTLEVLVGYPRKDCLSGQELIKIYQIYAKNQETNALDLLLLHNYDDLAGMFSLLPLGNLRQLVRGTYEAAAMEEITERTYEGEEVRRLLLTLSLPKELPGAFSLSLPQGYAAFQKQCVRLKLPLYEGTLKYFYPDYKNYYYLPYEDEAVHKSVGVYTDSSHRKNATAATCYKKVSGTFLMAPGSPALPLFREDFKAKEAYTLYPFPAPELLSAKEYAKGFFRMLFKQTSSSS